MSDDLTKALDRLRLLTDIAKQEEHPARKDAKVRRMLKQWAVVADHRRDLIAERKKTLKRLDQAWAWLRANEGDPAFTRREDQWLRWERKYVDIEQTIAEMDAARAYALEALDPIQWQEALAS